MVRLVCRGSLLVVLVAVVGLAGVYAAGLSDDPEQAVCGWLMERAAFALWSSVAGRPNPTAWKSVPGVEPVVHRTRDGRMLHGYRLAAHRPADAAHPATGFLLFAQGNAMLADRLLGDLTSFAERGVDVFVYDYRGYGRSQGNPRLKAIVDDYREIVDALGAGTPGRSTYLYGISFGGLVLLNVIGGRASFDKAVIDSTPSRVSRRGCPEQYDPVRNLPPDASRLLLISGGKDSVVKPADQAELRSVAGSRGARVVSSEAFAHPFMDRDVATHRARQSLINAFFFGER